MLQNSATRVRGLSRSPWRLVINTAPTVQPVTAAEVKSHVSVSVSDDDTLIDTYIAAATQKLDGAEGHLGRCLVQQTWDLKLDWFPSDGSPIRIPLAPLISVDSIAYTDENGDGQTLAASTYQVVGVGAHLGGEIVEAYNKSWPATRDIPEAITITFKAGYEPDDSVSPEDPRGNIPDPLKLAIYHLVADFYELRGSVDIGKLEIGMASRITRDLLSEYRVRWFA